MGKKQKTLHEKWEQNKFQIQKKKSCCLTLVLMETLEIVLIYCLNKGKSNFEKERT